MNIVAIIQARMGSSRLPGKVLKEILGKPMLSWVIERTNQANLIDKVIVATTTDASDDPIEKLCESISTECYRGHAFDVLDRFYKAASQHNAKIIVRITADCPLIDPGVIDLTIKKFLDHNADFAANRLPPPFKRTFPIGLDTEVCTFSALEQAWKEAKEPYEREHVMPYLYDEKGRFKIVLVDYPEDLGSIRLTVDTPEDLAFVRTIASHIQNNSEFNWLDIIYLLKERPELSQINKNVKHKNMKEIDARLQDQEKRI